MLKSMMKKNWIYLLVLIPFALIALFPLYWMGIASVKDTSSILAMPPQWVPLHPTFENFASLFRSSKLARWFFNSTFVAVAVTAGNIIFDAMAGYAFAKRNFAGRRLIFAAMIAGMMIPAQVTLIPLFLLMVNFGFFDHFTGLIIPSLATPFGIFLMKQFIESIPSEFEMAARLDGASELALFWRIIFPLSRPAWSMVGLFHFVGNWNAFLWPLIMTNSEEMRTLPVGLATLQSQYTIDFGLMMAGAMVTAMPMFVIFFAFQKQFFAGLNVGGLKS